MRLRLLGVLLVLAASLAACGGDDGAGTDAGPGSTITTPGVDGGPARTLPADAARARAEAIVLKRSDFPAAWTSEQPDTATAGNDAFRSCLGFDPGNHPSAESPTFRSGPATSVDSSATVAPSAKVIDREFAAFENPRALDCAARQFDDQAGQQVDATFGPASAERLDFPDVGDGSSAIRIVSTYTSEGRESEIYIDVVAVKKGRVGISLSLVDSPQAFPAGLATDLAGTMVDRA